MHDPELDLGDLAPDLDLGRRYLESITLPGRVMVAAVTGAHLYGFPSPDSDLDLKGIYLAPLRSLLGLGRPAESFDRMVVFDDVEVDLTLTEARQALDLLLRGNGNMLERILSPWQLQPSDELEELRALARRTISKKYFRHYQGFFRGKCRDHERSEAPGAKSLLYIYRVALTGIHLLHSGELCADLRVTAPRYGYDDALDLIALKTMGSERGSIAAPVDAHHRGNWQRLATDLEEAHATSSLPEQAPNAGELSEWLIQRRLAELDAGAPAGS
ncbi:MAG: nucleotidyltransferase domain-containing protein [Myxococcales bacterium]|nr:nucleotidyltransferase domain-containing protein [Myxococcales bacterium]MCB9702664.1 nucleotidyltransferase domain-containing protein [Myxococcales bacterium]